MNSSGGGSAAACTKSRHAALAGGSSATSPPNTHTRTAAQRTGAESCLSPSAYIVCSRWKRLRIAWSVRPGSRLAILCHLVPISCTLCRIVSSSVRLQLTRSGLTRSGLPPPSVESLRAGGGGGGSGMPLSRLFSRLHRLRTASSERPGSMAAITRHLQPCAATAPRIASSSAFVHSLRSPPLRPESPLPAALPPSPDVAVTDAGEPPAVGLGAERWCATIASSSS
mmetsp:Transcript_34252/g.94338  ORF Transcript_34252/g.94338 Transcript_34252/m.94338 type:complete len:226 (+) Transcript_34252:151-828(+)